MGGDVRLDDDCRMNNSFCTESIYFWLDCNEYKDIPHRDYLKLRAQKIYRKYICENSKLQVNLESNIVKEIITHLEQPKRNLFVPAQASITRMLEKDTLGKFRKTKHVSDEVGLCKGDRRKGN